LSKPGSMGQRRPVSSRETTENRLILRTNANQIKTIPCGSRHCLLFRGPLYLCDFCHSSRSHPSRAAGLIVRALWVAVRARAIAGVVSIEFYGISSGRRPKFSGQTSFKYPVFHGPLNLSDTKDLSVSFFGQGGSSLFRVWAALDGCENHSICVVKPLCFLSWFLSARGRADPRDRRSPVGQLIRNDRNTNKRGGRGPLKTPRTDMFVFGRTQPQARCCHYGTLKPTGLRRCCGAQLKSEAHDHTQGPPPIRNRTTAAVGATVVSRLTGCSNLLRPTGGCLSSTLPASSSCRKAPNWGPAVTRGPPTRHLPTTRIAQSLMYICVQNYLGLELINDWHRR
jgi:hypothetical protein